MESSTKSDNKTSIQSPEMSKESKEAVINQRIDEIRRRNEEILRRYQEIENDKMNAESLSREALESLKRMPRDDSAEPDTSLHIQVVERPAKKERPVRRSQIIPAVTSEDQMHFRPQRLSETDLPPPDPVFSYLADRLREGALCAPISPPTPRRRRSSATSSHMSVGGSSANSSRKASTSSSASSRKLSTASNSSWTSDTSTRSGLGFANYQPPRKYSATRDYVKNRRVSRELFASAEETEYETWKADRQIIDQQRIDQQRIDNDGTAAKRWIRDWDSTKGDDIVIENVAEWNSKSASQTRGNRLAQKNNKTRKASKSGQDRSDEMTGNWRERPITTSTIKPTMSTSAIIWNVNAAEFIASGMGRLTLDQGALSAPSSTREDLNNNDGTEADRNVRNLLTSAQAPAVEAL